MAEITVISMQQRNGWSCTVQVTEPNGQTRHCVDLSQRDFDALKAEKATTPEELVKKSFEFLLERESKEQILRQFSLPMISRYFPDYPAEILKKL